MRVAERAPEKRKEQVASFFSVVRRAKDLGDAESQRLLEYVRHLRREGVRRVPHRAVPPLRAAPRTWPRRTEERQLSGGSDPWYVRGEARVVQDRFVVVRLVAWNVAKTLDGANTTMAVGMSVATAGACSRVGGSGSVFVGGVSATRLLELKTVLGPASAELGGTRSPLARRGLELSLSTTQAGSRSFVSLPTWWLDPTLFLRVPEFMVETERDVGTGWTTTECFRDAWSRCGRSHGASVVCEARWSDEAVDWRSLVCHRFPLRVLTSSSRAAMFAGEAWFSWGALRPEPALVLVSVSASGNDVLGVEVRCSAPDAFESDADARAFVEQAVLCGCENASVVWLSSSSGSSAVGGGSSAGATTTMETMAAAAPSWPGNERGLDAPPDAFLDADTQAVAWGLPPSSSWRLSTSSSTTATLPSVFAAKTSADLADDGVRRWRAIKGLST